MVVTGLTELFDTLPLDIVERDLVDSLSILALERVLPVPFNASDLTLVTEVEGTLPPLV